MLQHEHHNQHNVVVDIPSILEKTPKRSVSYTSRVICLLSFGTSIYILFYWIYHYVGLWGLIPAPFMLFLGGSFINVIVSMPITLLTPARWIQTNTVYHSASPLLVTLPIYPHITIHIPVYKEDFKTVIIPTLESAQRACNTYPGVSNILISDDALTILETSDRTERLNYYTEHKYCYIGRPPNNRAGQFKKASNMNYTIQKLLEAGRSTDPTTYLKTKTTSQFYIGDNYQPLGRYILILDSDSRMPENILGQVIPEIELDPKIGFIQFRTKAFSLGINNFWTRVISTFTDYIYDSVFPVTTSCGDNSPLVGHNALIRVKPLLALAWTNEQALTEGGTGAQTQYWSEEHVSEDFYTSLRFQANGYYGRYVSYTTDFHEGVTLNVRDEITRFCKYSYGAAEVMINPIKRWRKSGILGSALKEYLSADNIKWYSKYNCILYLGSYYALALAPLLTVINYFTFSYSADYRTKVSSSLDITLSCVGIYSAGAPLYAAIMKWKLGISGFFRAIVIEFRQTLVLSIFFTGLSFHLFQVLMCHALAKPLNWTSTNKKLEVRSRWSEFCDVISSYRTLYIINVLLAAMMIYLYHTSDWWAIRNVSAVVPLGMLVSCTMLSPLLLNTKIVC